MRSVSPAEASEGSVGLDLDDQLVEVGGLLDPDGLDRESHPTDRREDGIDRDDADGAGALVLVGRHVAAAPLDGEVHGDVALGVEGGDVLAWAQHLDVSTQLQVASRSGACALLVEADGHRLVAVDLEQEVLQVQDDVGDILLDARQGRELVEGLIEPHLSDGSTRDRRKKRPPQRVAERVAEAGVERSDRELLAVVLFFADCFDGGSLDDEHAYVAPRQMVRRFGLGRFVT